MGSSVFEVEGDGGGEDLGEGVFGGELRARGGGGGGYAGSVVVDVEEGVEGDVALEGYFGGLAEEGGC